MRKTIKTLEELEREDIYQAVKSFLKEDFLTLQVKTFELIENYETEKTEICCVFSDGGEKNKVIRGLGHGTLDALYHALLYHYKKEAPSIENITFEGFSVRPDWRTKTSSGSDAEVEVEIEFRNSMNSIVTFRNKGRSFVKAAVKGVFDAIEFYINAEIYFRKLKGLIAEAKGRNRSDLVQSYVSRISEIVRVTSYEEV